MPEALISAGTALINALAHVKRTRARLSVLIRLPPRYDEITQQVAQRRTINHKIVLEVSGIYSRHCSEHELCTTVVGHTGFICPYQHASYMHLLGKRTAAQFRVCIAPSAFQLFRGRNEVLRGRKLIKGTLARNQKKKKKCCKCRYALRPVEKRSPKLCVPKRKRQHALTIVETATRVQQYSQPLRWREHNAKLKLHAALIHAPRVSSVIQHACSEERSRVTCAVVAYCTR